MMPARWVVVAVGGAVGANRVLIMRYEADCAAPSRIGSCRTEQTLQADDGASGHYVSMSPRTGAIYLAEVGRSRIIRYLPLGVEPVRVTEAAAAGGGVAGAGGGGASAGAAEVGEPESTAVSMQQTHVIIERHNSNGKTAFTGCHDKLRTDPETSV